MTEAEWLRSTDPYSMLRHLVRQDGPTLRGNRDRKPRLFACACARTLWPYLEKEWTRHVVQVAERYADGLATEAERNRTAAAAARLFKKPADSAAYRTLALNGLSVAG